MILTLAKQTLCSRFSTMLAWVIPAIVLLLLAYLFVSGIEEYRTHLQNQLARFESAPGVTALLVSPLYGNAAVIMLVTIPLLTMNMVAGDRQNRSLVLLQSAPVSATEIVLGRYLGLLAYLIGMIVLISLMPLSLLAVSRIDTGQMAACMLGLALLLAAFSAIGLLFSCLCRSPAVAAASTFAVLLLLWILDWAKTSYSQPGGLLEYVSMLNHFNRLKSGMIDSSDVVYFVLITLLGLIFSIRLLDTERYRQ